MHDLPIKPSGNVLIQLVTIEMPFGKFKGTLLCNLPVFYLEWFQRKGFPKGQLGMLLASIYEIKMNGLEYLLKPLKELYPDGKHKENVKPSNEGHGSRKDAC